MKKTMRGKWYQFKNDTTSLYGVKFLKGQLVKIEDSYMHFFVIRHDEQTLLIYKEDLMPYLEVKAVNP